MRALGLIGLLLVSAAPQDTRNATKAILDSKTAHEALFEVAHIELSPSQSLLLEPGVRLSSVDSMYTLGSYSGRRIQIETSNGIFSYASPLKASLTNDGLQIDGNTWIKDSHFSIRLEAQDDTDTNLKSMQESAKKLKTQSNNQDASQQPTKKLKHRWLFGENPNPTAELFNKAAIQQLTHLSPIGF